MKHYRQILNDEKLDEQLHKEGYVIIPFLNEEELQSLLHVFNNEHQQNIEHFYATAHHQDLTFRQRMSYTIKSALHLSTKLFFNNCNLLGGSYIVKPPGEYGLLQPHQDWNIVDEDYFRSFNVWLPLVDLNEENGTIQVLPKSHSWLKGYRHSSIPCAFQNVHHLVWENLQPLYLKAGEALIYDHALLHASGINKSNDLRIACACGIIPSEAEMKFYWNNNGVVEEYESSPEFFMKENIFSGPNGLKKIQDLQYNFHQINEIEFYKISGIPAPEPTFLDIEVDSKQRDINENQEQLPFWKVYTLLNIFREIKHRIG